MPLLREPNDTFEVEVFYVYDENDNVCILNTELDIDTIKKTEEEKKEMDEDDRYSTATDVPFNRSIDLLNYNEDDLKKAIFKFRKPVFNDMPILLSCFSNINEKGNISPSDLFDYAFKQLNLLFVKGKAQEKDGKFITIDETNVTLIPPSLGAAMAFTMAKKLNLQ